MSYCKDKQTYLTYQFFFVEGSKFTVLLELNQSLTVSPGDVIVEIPEEGYLLMNKQVFEDRFETIKDER